MNTLYILWLITGALSYLLNEILNDAFYTEDTEMSQTFKMLFFFLGGPLSLIWLLLFKRL